MRKFGFAKRSEPLDGERGMCVNAKRGLAPKEEFMRKFGFAKRSEPLDGERGIFVNAKRGLAPKEEFMRKFGFAKRSEPLDGERGMCVNAKHGLAPKEEFMRKFGFAKRSEPLDGERENVRREYSAALARLHEIRNDFDFVDDEALTDALIFEENAVLKLIEKIIAEAKLRKISIEFYEILPK